MIINLNEGTTDYVTEKYCSYHRGIFGLVFHYKEYAAYSGVLAQGENLYICALNTIGAEFGEPCFSPRDLAGWLDTHVLPWNYGGNIYVAASGSQPHCINGLLSELGEDFVNRVFGIFCIDDGHIEPPGHQGWIAAVA